MNLNQVAWQGSALRVLLNSEGVYNSPWVPVGEVIAAVRSRADCSPQAASGALRALLYAGLADRCETHEGVFWKPSIAARRADALI